MPVVAATNHGGVRTNIDREQFSDFHLSGPDKQSRVRRDWSGFRKAEEGVEQFAAILKLLDRFAAVLEGESRSSGLDLMTRSGRIVVVRE